MSDYVEEPIGQNARFVKPGYITASERAVERWSRDAESVLSENFYHLVANEPQPLPPTDIENCEHDVWKVCARCGHDLGQAEEDF